MSKSEIVSNSEEMDLRNYEKILENLRIRINVLNASVFLLEEKMTTKDLSVRNYIAKINQELEEIRKLMIPVSMQYRKIN